MTTIPKIFSLIGGAFLCSLFLFPACKNADSGGGVGDTKYENKVVQYCSIDPKQLTPYNMNDANARIMVHRTHQSLIQLDMTTYELVPVLAKKRPVISTVDGKVQLSMEIREEAKWDNGKPITGEDVAFSLKMMKVPKLDNASLKPYFEYIEDIEIDKENPKKFILKCGKPYMGMEAALTSFQIIPAYIYDKENRLSTYTVNQLATGGEKLKSDKTLDQVAENYNSAKFQREVMVGSGPYEYVSWETNQRVIFKLKKDWWGHKFKSEHHWFDAKAEEIVYEVITDPTTAVVALKGEKIDAMYRISPRIFVEDLQKSENWNKKFTPHTPPQFLYSYFGINTRNPKFKDVRTRKALRLIMDIDQYEETVFYGMSERVTSFIHPLKTKFINKNLKLYNQDLDGARKLLAEAGWKDTDGNGIVDIEIDGERVDFTIDFIYPNSAKTSEQGVLMYQEFCKKVGIKLNALPVEFSVMLDKTKQHKFEMYFGIWSSSPLESDPKQIWHSASYNGGSNYVGFGNPKSDDLIEKLRAELDENKRAVYYKELQQIIDDEVPYIFLAATKNRVAIHKKFLNAKATGINPGFYAPGLQVVNAIAN